MASRLRVLIWWMLLIQIYFSATEKPSNTSFEEKFDKALNQCVPPPILSDFYVKETNSLDMKAVYEFYVALRSQIHLRYGKNQIIKALNGIRSKVKFDELDNAYFFTRDFINCHRSKEQIKLI